MKAKERQIK